MPKTKAPVVESDSDEESDVPSKVAVKKAKKTAAAPPVKAALTEYGQTIS